MKKIFLIIVIFTSLAPKSGKPQAPVADTLAYLQSIVANKTLYTGKSFSVLQDSLKIQIKFFSPFAGINHDKRKETSTSFSFYFPTTPEKIYLTKPCLEIYWYPYLNSTQSLGLYRQYNGGQWVPAVATFYSPGVVADIKVRE